MMTRRIAMLAPLLALLLLCTGCPKDSSQTNTTVNTNATTPPASPLRTARKVDYDLAQTMRTAINTKRDLRKANKITAAEAVQADKVMLKIQAALKIYHQQVSTAPADGTSINQVCTWFQPVGDALGELNGLAFKNPDSQATFQSLLATVQSIGSVTLKCPAQ